MKSFILFMLILTGYTCCAQQPALQSLYRLTGGSWHMKTAKGITGEKWIKVNNNELRNQAFKINGEDTTLLEKVQLVKKGNDIYYISMVQNQNDGKAVPFKLTESKSNRFTFSNSAHDFPQRIVYHFIAQDSIHAWIDGKYNGKFVKQDFYYNRVK